MLKLLFIALVLAGAPAFPQLESHTLTISANRQMIPQPDQVVFGLSVSASANTSFDQIVAALSSLNITSANLTGVSNSDPTTLQWSFNLALPLSNLTATIGSLTRPQNNSGITVDFSVAGLQVSPQLQQSESCSTPDLIADARAQAQKLAQAASMTAGPILRLSNITLLQPSEGPTTSFPISDFLLGLPSPPPLNCSLTVEFQLLP